jgi:hypothetical protein
MTQESEQESGGRPPVTPSPDSIGRVISTALAGLAAFYLATASIDATIVAAALIGLVVIWYMCGLRP